MQLDLTYLPAEDRMEFSMRGQVHWQLTRSLLLKLVGAWVDKLQSIELPNVGISLGQRDIGLEHTLSLEFDGPQNTSQKPEPAPNAKLLQEVNLTVDALGATLVMKGAGLQTSLSLSRKESHMVLEMLASKARAVKWLDGVEWPQWLGVNN